MLCKCQVKDTGEIYLSCDKHFYTVPYEHVGRKADIIYTRSLVKVFVDNKSVATIPLDRTPGAHTQIPENLAPNVRSCLERSPHTDARPDDNNRAIADVQPDGHQQVVPVSTSDGHAQELLHAERHRHQPDGARRAGRRRVNLHQQAVHKHEGPSCGMRRSGHLSSEA